MSKLSFNSKYSTKKNLNLIQNHQCLQMLIDQVSCIQKQDFYLKILNCLRNLRLILKKFQHILDVGSNRGAFVEYLKKK